MHFCSLQWPRCGVAHMSHNDNATFWTSLAFGGVGKIQYSFQLTFDSAPTGNSLVLNLDCLLLNSSSTTVYPHNTLLRMILQMDDKLSHDSDMPNKPPASEPLDPPPAYSGPGPVTSAPRCSYALPTSSQCAVPRQPSGPREAPPDSPDLELLIGREYEQRCKHYSMPRRDVSMS